MTGLNEMRSIDQARAARFIIASMTGDTEMFATTLQETFDDDFGFGQMGSTINVIRSLSDDLGGALVDIHGAESAAALVRTIVARLSTDGADDAPE